MSDVPQVLIEPGFVPDHEVLCRFLIDEVPWDTRMQARLTASYGLPYDYAGMSYEAQPMLAPLHELCGRIAARLGFEPNNCLLNYYMDGRSKMGFHADDITVLEGDTGVAIVSLGGVRPLRFRRQGDPTVRHELRQEPGSLLYMPQEVHRGWVHAIPRVPQAEPRISLTFRRLRST